MTTARTGPRTRQEVALLLAPAVFVLLWSTGFVGAKYGLPYAAPFTFLAVRLLIAAVLLAVLALVLRTPAPRGRTQWGRSALTGVLLHAGYLGGVFWAISRGFPAGVSSVVVSLQPVLVAALAGTVLGETLRRVQWVGLVVGVVGVGLVLAPGLAAADGVPVSGLLSCLVALGAGTAGTLHQKRHGGGIPLLGGTAVQYAAAGVLLGVLALSTEDTTVEWTPRFVAALAWLVLALSIGAVLLLLVLLRRGSASGVSSLFYLVPPATAVEAYLLFGETLAPVSVLGIVVAAVGVALVVRTPRTPPELEPV
ncbi:DMT family transporter [Rhodococcus antarcticus]|uniref:DMT family transporter n=1 Tax=Rhodococcus antarcticus TaxID=2987751 RepID=A0ABY6P426_9NOCA|nr:DMT family transporter [Rhodococcus antarcticus]UZJ25838.1 DMT family transporter [Rhodococcus antarcticus]